MKKREEISFLLRLLTVCLFLVFAAASPGYCGDSTSTSCYKRFAGDACVTESTIKGSAHSCSFVVRGSDGTSAPFAYVRIVLDKRSWRWGRKSCARNGRNLYVYCGRTTQEPLVTASVAQVLSSYSVRSVSAFVHSPRTGRYDVYGFYCLDVGLCFGAVPGGRGMNGSAGDHMLVSVTVECMPNN